MRRQIASLVLLLGVLSLPASARSPARVPAPPTASVHVAELAGDIGPRPAGGPADRRASRYIARELGSYGYEVERVPFRLPQGGRSWNVVARAPDATEPPSLIIGAHYDTVPGSPGANDNASGIGAMLEAAVKPTVASNEQTIAFVAFGAEEYQASTGRHHVGSAAYVRAMDEAERDALAAMVSVDMIGKVRRFIVARLAGSKRGGSRLLAQAVRDAGLRPRVRVLADISDHGPFARAGMPAAFLWTGDEPNHHEPTDRVRNVSDRALDRAVRVLRRLVELAA